MTEDGTEGADNLGLEMLTAAHALLNSDRLANEKDLLISTCIEILASGPASTATLNRTVNEIWPGSNIEESTIDGALNHAREVGLVGRLETLDGSNDWALAKNGMDEIDATRVWLEEAMGRLARQIQDRANEDFGEVNGELASNWATLLLNIFTAEIAKGAALYGGKVQEGAAGNVRPMALDAADMLKAVEDRSLPVTTKEFLQGCLLAAVDEADPFGNELVGYVATSCVLHAVAAGRGRSAARSVLGSLGGQRAVLDTPLLLDFLGPESSASNIRTLIDRAIATNMEVIVPDHVLEELRDLVDRLSDQFIPALLSALGSGTGAHAYAQTVNEQALELFLTATETGVYSRWEDFVARARSLSAELTSLGVIVRGHENRDRGNIAWIDQELTAETQKSPIPRTPKAVARDAESIELVWRARRRFIRRKGALWPGGWLISTDRRINAVYRRLSANDPHALVLTPAQWATLMTETAATAEVKDLVDAAASLLRRESMLKIATKYPPKIALALAKSLSGEFISDTDLRMAQLNFEDMLDHAAGEETLTGERIAGDIASKRSNRLAAAGREQIQAASTERTRMTEKILKTDAVLARAERRGAELEERNRELEASRGLEGRKIARAVIITVGVLGTIALISIQFWWFATGTAISTLLFLPQSRKWVSDKDLGVGTLLISLIPESIALLELLPVVRQGLGY